MIIVKLLLLTFFKAGRVSDKGDPQQLHLFILESAFTKMKLITEEINKVEFIVEEVGGKKSMFIEGSIPSEATKRIAMVVSTNRYTMQREVGRYTEQYIDNGRALGELGHPDGPTVNLDRVSHKIVSLAGRQQLYR